jgi:hypothetical protein
MKPSRAPIAGGLLLAALALLLRRGTFSGCMAG